MFTFCVSNLDALRPLCDDGNAGNLYGIVFSLTLGRVVVGNSVSISIHSDKNAQLNIFQYHDHLEYCSASLWACFCDTISGHTTLSDPHCEALGSAVATGLSLYAWTCTRSHSRWPQTCIGRYGAFPDFGDSHISSNCSVSCVQDKVEDWDLRLTRTTFSI